MALLGLLWGEVRHHRGAVVFFKPLASAGFLATAWLTQSPASLGGWLLAALLCCAAGDVLLIPRGRTFFLLGLGAFLAGHLLYALRFSMLAQSPSVAVTACILLLIPAWRVWRWLGPHVPTPMKMPVLAYMGAISLMLGLAIGHGVAAQRIIPGVAALLFYVSDLAVARDRFVRPGVWNRVWGLPLYYAAQLLFAAAG